VRFGFKTSPQDTTWDAMLEVWRAADGIEVFESGWTSGHCAPRPASPSTGTSGAGRPPYTPAMLEPLASALSSDSIRDHDRCITS
jgi:hypothetical protein